MTEIPNPRLHNTSAHSVWRHACLRVCAAAEQLGVNTGPILEEVGLVLVDLQTPGFRVPLAVHQNLVLACVLSTGRQDLALFMNQEMPALGNTLVQNSVVASESGVAAFQRFKQLMHIVDTSLSLGFEISGHVTACVLQEAEVWPDPIAHFPEDLSISSVIQAGRALLGSTKMHQTVEFRRDEPEDATPWYELFGNEIVWGAAQSRIWFKTADVSRIRPEANERLAQANFESAEKYKSVESALVQSVIVSIRKWLPQGKVVQQRVASDVGLQVRTLQRSLKAESTSFGRLLADERRRQAMERLSLGQPVGVIAAELGYVDQSAFSSAFKGWVGVSPIKYKAAQVI
ncbi:AraC family transcriptional regulator ligand-binding domain-containing protein [Luminiphilus sp. nBUS_16]|uniref:AraC family transcriptional regulator n=1 Tax=Luminiphilus sp. nBUS_16 TaxID=3395315 RepID=UPI003EBAD9DD